MVEGILSYFGNFTHNHWKNIYTVKSNIFCSEYDDENQLQCSQVQGNKKSKPPYQMKIFKGYKNVMIRRDFAKFLIYHPVAKAFEEYMKDTLIPDEHIYATMSRIKQVEEILNNKENNTLEGGKIIAMFIFSCYS